MGKDIIVGDIHGCIDELVRLVDAVAPTQDDTVVSVGDLLDKGPDSAGVVRYLRELRSRCNVIVVRGNHEDKHHRWRKHQTLQTKTGKKNPMVDRSGELDQITKTLTPEDIEFLDACPVFHKLSGTRGIVVHAGISPFLRSIPTVAPTMTARDDILNTCQWIRCITPAGNAVSLGNEQPEDSYWAASYNGHFGHAFFGHQPFVEKFPQQFPHATGLDLGCCYGLRLAAAIVDDDRVEYEVIQATRQYAKSHFDGLPGFMNLATAVALQTQG